MKTFKIAFFALLFMMTGAVSAATVTVTEGLGAASVIESLAGSPMFSTVGTEFVNIVAVGGATTVDLSWVIQDIFANTVTGFGASLVSSTGVTVSILSGYNDSITIMGLDVGLYSVIFSGTPTLVGGLSDITTGASATFLAATSAVSAVPLPAAVWLFGSALVGLFGASRRKSSAMAA